MYWMCAIKDCLTLVIPINDGSVANVFQEIEYTFILYFAIKFVNKTISNHRAPSDHASSK